MVSPRPQRSHDPHQVHHTCAKDLLAFMISRLQPSDRDVVWEPSAGDGHLIDAVLRVAPAAYIHASELRSDAAQQLSAKYLDRSRVSVRCEDALAVPTQEEMGLFAASQIKPPTRIIANPPYGAWQTPERRATLKQRFPRLYVRETYSTILYHSLRRLVHGGRLVFLIPDTFLWLHRHEFLRRELFGEYTVEELALFPSKFFPGVNFSYSGMCVLTVVRRLPGHLATTRIISEIKDVSVLGALAHCMPADGYVVRRELQVALVANEVAGLVEASQNRSAITTLGDLAEVRTGFYSGNDRRWIRRAGPAVRRSAAYADVDPAAIFLGQQPPALAGINGSRHFIPIIRGGAASFVKPDDWYVDWSTSAVAEYTRAGPNPARFQNSRFYFREGIAVPMVASSRVTACLMRRRLFDQGIVGVFPKDDSYLLFLLGFLNTEIVTRMLRAINGTANNSANYVKRIPIALPNASQLRRANDLVTLAMGNAEGANDGNHPVRGEIEALYRHILVSSGMDVSPFLLLTGTQQGLAADRPSAGS